MTVTILKPVDIDPTAQADADADIDADDVADTGESTIDPASLTPTPPAKPRNTLEQIAADADASRASALRDYRRLVARLENPADGDAGRLERAMAALGLSADDVKADAAALAEEARLVRQAPPDAADGHRKAIDDATAAARQFYAQAFADLMQRLPAGMFVGHNIDVHGAFTNLVAVADPDIGIEERGKLYDAANAAQHAISAAHLTIESQQRLRENLADRIDAIRKANPRVFATD